MDKVIIRTIKRDLSKLPEKLGPLEHSPRKRDRRREAKFESELKKIRRKIKSIQHRLDA